jgi:hypothetical protein
VGIAEEGAVSPYEAKGVLKMAYEGSGLRFEDSGIDAAAV